VELDKTWQPADAVSAQLPEDLAVPGGGPRDPFAPPVILGESPPVASLCTVPAQPPEPAWQPSVAIALDQLEAPGTVRAAVAPAPGEPAGELGDAGGVAGC
jgi:hypothetical protein